MSELKERLDNLRALMQEPEFLEGKGLSNEVNIRIFCYDPSDEMMVRHFIEQIMTDQSMNCHLIEHRLLFSCYLTGLISLVVLPANFWLSFFDGIFLGWWDEMLPIFSFGEFNLVPSFIKALSGELTIGSWVKTMLIGNIAMFLPMGFFLPFVTEKINRKNIFVVAIAVPFIVELLQMVFGRSFDIDDLSCNFIGIAVGFFIGFAIKNTKQKSKLNVN